MTWMTENTNSHFKKATQANICSSLPSQPLALSHIWQMREKGQPANVSRWPWQCRIITASKTATVYSLWSGKRRTFISAVALQKPASVQRPWISSRQQAAHSVSSESENLLLTKQRFTSVHLHDTRLALDTDSTVILLYWVIPICCGSLRIFRIILPLILN